MNGDLLIGAVDASWLVVRSRPVNVSDYRDTYPSVQTETFRNSSLTHNNIIPFYDNYEVGGMVDMGCGP